MSLHCHTAAAHCCCTGGEEPVGQNLAPGPGWAEYDAGVSRQCCSVTSVDPFLPQNGWPLYYGALFALPLHRPQLTSRRRQPASPFCGWGTTRHRSFARFREGVRGKAPARNAHWPFAARANQGWTPSLSLSFGIYSFTVILNVPLRQHRTSPRCHHGLYAEMPSSHCGTSFLELRLGRRAQDAQRLVSSPDDSQEGPEATHAGESSSGREP